MRVIFRWLGRIALMLTLAALVVGLWKREQLQRLWAVQSLFSESKIVSNFSNMNAAFLSRPVSRGDGPVSELPKGPDATLPPTTADWITERTVTSLLVLQKGQIVHESYYQGTGADDRRISWSVAKSYLSALFGILVAEGQITSLDDEVTQYAPVLTGSAYDGATIRNLLQMTSGVTFDEDYLDYHSDINRMGRVLALGGTMDGFAAGLTARDAEPGRKWHYVSIDTHIVGMVVRGATGRDIPDLLSEKIIAPLGQEAEPYYLTDGQGVAFVLGGLNQSTRDYARFGLMIARMGRYNGQQVVPVDWVAASTRASAPTAPGEIRYGYQWWIPKDGHDGEFFGHGIYGQFIYIDQTRDVVIVSTAADRKFREPGVRDANIAMFRQIAAAL
ncbi:6-aminohexanoate-dimer hydrolase [Roseovarius litorisediminis]|uniref:6-aminohexanoate-dimer hydrolase n=1 Tax=Roseovarius litorisediminis TaxID=1312363 RepID=A0A1Y5TMQ0_9RHOB|nr:serine hydrolase [Roseovarius litorisediminis]SLN63745.1 6-aminohexanoate-dimer hydrolase [Roseovarius litorisediminis]